MPGRDELSAGHDGCQLNEQFVLDFCARASRPSRTPLTGEGCGARGDLTPGDASISPRASRRGGTMLKLSATNESVERFPAADCSSTYTINASPVSDSRAGSERGCSDHAALPPHASRLHTLEIHGQASTDVTTTPTSSIELDERARRNRRVDRRAAGAATARGDRARMDGRGSVADSGRVRAAGERRPAAGRARVGAALQLPAGQRLDGRGEDRGPGVRTDRPARRRHARARPPVSRAADRGAAPARSRSARRPTPRARPGAWTCSRGCSPIAATASTRSPPAITASSTWRSSRARSRSA